MAANLTISSVSNPITTLHNVEIIGYEPESDAPQAIDPPGEANNFCSEIGMAIVADADDDTCGILWTDYDSQRGHDFHVLVTEAGLETIREWINAQEGEDKYTIGEVEEVTEATRYGDGGGTVAICRHPDGWVLIG